MRPEKILLVGEDADQATFAAWLLKQELPSAEVVEVQDPDALEEALASASCDLVLTGFRFPWGSGMYVLALVRRYLPGCPVVLLTAHGSEEVVYEALRKGFTDYFPANARGYLRLGKRVRSILVEGGQATASGVVAQYERLIELLDQGTFVATREGLLLQANSAFARVVKSGGHEKLRGRPLTDFLKAERLRGFLEGLDPKGQTGTAQIPLKEGADTVRVSACLVPQGDRLPTALVGTIQRGESEQPPLSLCREHRVVDHPEPDITHPDKVDLGKVLDVVLIDLSASLEQAKATVDRAKLPVIQGSYGDMVYLFRNLLSSVITIRTAESVRIGITAHRMPTEWLFIAKASGSRIGEADLRSMTPRHPEDERFESGKSLAACRRIVERHGGRLWVASEGDGRSSIYFTLANGVETLGQEEGDGTGAGS